jgi:hypothetical protein
MMKTILSVLAFGAVIAACAGQPPTTAKYIEGSACIRPGGECDYSDQCCSHVCDANSCRGPIPGPGGP